jgi:riboflavin biosynthesis pyrimidine reductase
MKPFIICHMMSSLDGHSLTDGWNMKTAADIYEDAAATFKADAWVCGRVTMQEIAHGDDYPKGLAKKAIAREHFFADRKASQYAISIDPKGRVAWKTNTALKSHVVEVLAESVPDDFLAYLQSIGVSYVFGGKTEIDLHKVVEVLTAELGLKKLIVEGGAHVSGAFVAAGLVDEVSVIIHPLVDGRGAHPASFEIDAEPWKPAYLKLQSVEKLRDDAVWLRYAIKAGAR